jgi:hydrogenase maturation protease
VLYEGYLLYPYRPSAVKNRQRWNFGALCPESYARAQNGTERSTMRTECLIEVDSSTTVDVTVRFLHLLLREVTVDGKVSQPWQEAVEREVVVPRINLDELKSPRLVGFNFSAGKITEDLERSAGMIVRTQHSIAGEVEVSATGMDGRLRKLSVVIRNLTAFADAQTKSRDDALLHSFVSTHTILTTQKGSFVSLLDLPDSCKAAAAECVNTGTYPVLVGDEGERNCVLSSPIILYDYPQIAPESAGDLFDGTEIDEILTLRIMSLTDDEKSEMRSADELARQLLERTESMSAEQLMNLHGVMKRTGVE